MKQTLDLNSASNEQGLTVQRMGFLLIGFTCVLLVVTMVMGAMWALKRQQASVAVETQTEQASVESVKANNQEDRDYKVLSQILEQALYKPQWVKQLNPVSLSRVLTVLASSEINTLWLESIEINFHEQTFYLSGQSQTPKALMDWLRFLKGAKTFGEATLKQVKFEQKEQTYPFELEGQL